MSSTRTETHRIGGLSSRIVGLMETMHELDTGGVRMSIREDLIRESFAETLSDPFPIRRAKGFCYLLDHTEPVIHDHETILGSLIGLFPLRAEQLSLESIYREASSHIRELIDGRYEFGEERKTAQLEYDYRGPRVSYSDLKSVSQRIAAETTGNGNLTFTQVFSALEDHFCDSPQAIALTRLAMRTDGTLESTREKPLWTMTHHVAADYEKVLVNGYPGILDEAAALMDKAESEEARIFYRAVIISIEGAIAFIRRYAEAAREKRETETDPVRRAELAEMARIAENVADAPASDYREAVQLFWFTHLMLCIAGGISLSAGRFDQYMNPFYQQDLKAGRLDRSEALELLACLWVKFNEPVIGPVQNLTVGGMTPEGSDGTNPMTYLCLETTRTVKLPYPNITLRLFQGTDENIYPEISRMIKAGTGHPALLNDDVMVPALHEAGAALEHARDYIIQGCTEVMIAKRQPPWENGHKFALPDLLNQAIRERLDATSYQDLLTHFKSVISTSMDVVAERIKQRWEELHRVGCDPFGSALVQDCLERGRDIYQGGTRYPATAGISLMGLATTADSLAAIKRLVFDEGKLSLREFWAVLERNFEGDEPFRQELLNRMPKYGNDDEYVDSIAGDIAGFFCRTVLKHNEWPEREAFVPRLHSYISHITGGLFGATADGRQAGEPMSDAASPAQGRDHVGPTATMNSVTKFDYSQVPGGIGMNMKFHPDIFRGADGERVFVSLVKAYFQRGGLQISFNLVGKETLEDAMAHPEDHQNLIVRVAGFNEYFCKLDPKLQRDILERTAHELAG